MLTILPDHQKDGTSGRKLLNPILREDIFRGKWDLFLASGRSSRGVYSRYPIFHGDYPTRSLRCCAGFFPLIMRIVVLPVDEGDQPHISVSTPVSWFFLNAISQVKACESFYAIWSHPNLGYVLGINWMICMPPEVFWDDGSCIITRTWFKGNVCRLDSNCTPILL